MTSIWVLDSRVVLSHFGQLLSVFVGLKETWEGPERAKRHTMRLGPSLTACLGADAEMTMSPFYMYHFPGRSLTDPHRLVNSPIPSLAVLRMNVDDELIKKDWQLDT